MGWFDSIRYLTSNAYCIFVPEWGWVGSKLSEKYNKLLTIFVPVWGWVGSINIKDTIIEHRNFRPRLGLGWFLSDDCRGCQRNEIFVPEWGWGGSNRTKRQRHGTPFSSPSGDGLVLVYRIMQLFAINFRPRVGMGWFLCKNGSITLPKQIFVPAWGWVGSLCLLLKCANLRGIRPRLGMGWFASMLDGYVLSEKFSSPLGDGLVR